MELRPYQTELLKKIDESWAAGARNVLLRLPTGGGKTRIFCSIISNRKIPSVVIVHRVELVQQVSITLAGYGITHNIITNKSALREIINAHLCEYKKSYFDGRALVTVIGVDTLIKMDYNTKWIKKIQLVVQDEGHHVLKENKWGTAANYFPNALGLYPTATPRRADGMGLGRHADGVIDAKIEGPTFEELIAKGYLVPYQIFVPPSDLELTDVPLAAGGDFSPAKLRTAVHKSTITGNAIKHYLKLCPGKLALIFTVDVESAVRTAEEFRVAGIPTEVLTSKTSSAVRYEYQARFRRREILVIVNVDLFGEGVDVPELEVVIMLRPTQSFSLYVQQFGRALRLSAGKTHAIIIDHVGNVMRHGLPDPLIPYSLDRAERRKSSSNSVVQIKTCLSEECLRVYDRCLTACPYCGYKNPIASRRLPAEVEGDLCELDPDVLDHLRGIITTIDGTPKIPRNLSPHVQRAIVKRHEERQRAQLKLREKIALFAGFYKQKNVDDSIIYRKFFMRYDIDILTAQTLGAPAAVELSERIDVNLREGLK